MSVRNKNDRCTWYTNSESMISFCLFSLCSISFLFWWRKSSKKESKIWKTHAHLIFPILLTKLWRTEHFLLLLRLLSIQVYIEDVMANTCSTLFPINSSSVSQRTHKSNYHIYIRTHTCRSRFLFLFLLLNHHSLVFFAYSTYLIGNFAMTM
jgi:hypothetical protein